MASGMPSTTATEVSLERYAGIIVALDEGHPLAAVLAQEQVAADAWDAIDVDFKDRLSQDRELFSEYAACVIEAEDQLARGVSPLADDPAAYLAFVAGFAASDSGTVLDTHALKLADIGRLGRQWERRFAADEALRQRAFEQAQAISPPITIRCEVAELRPFRWTRGIVPSAPLPADETDPPADDPLLRTLDPSRLPSAYRPSTRRSSFPVATARPRRSLEPSPTLGETSPHAGASKEPATPFRGRRGAPRPIASSLEPHAELGATAPLDPSVGASAQRGLEPVPALARTAPIGARPRGPATPFASGPAAPFPSATGLEPPASMGLTAPAGDSRPRGIEPVAHLGDTAPLAAARPGDPAGGLPFEGTHQPPPAAKLEPHSELGATATLDDTPKRSLEPNPALGGTIVMPPRSDEPKR